MKRVQMYVGTGIGEQWKKLLSTPEKLVVDSEEAERVISDTLLENGILGFTLQNGKGFWNGKSEKTLIVTVYYTDSIPVPNWLKIGKKIGNELYQDCIMIDLDGEVYFIDSTEVIK